MIALDKDSRLTKWFVWSCDHLPLTVTRDYSDKTHPDGVRRTSAHYLSTGTTLCHIFWAMLWVPLAIAAICGFFLFVFGIAHVASYREHGAQLGVVAFFIPEAVMAIVAACMGLLILIVIGGDKSGFFKLLWAYLSGIKSRICPLVQFGASNQAAE